MIFGAAARSLEGHLLRDATFFRTSLQPLTDYYVRKVGRPRLEWTTEVRKIALAASGGRENLERCIQQKETWEKVVQTYCEQT